MSEWLESIWNSMTALFDWVIWFLSGGIFEPLTDAFEYLIDVLKLTFLEISIWSLETLNTMVSTIFANVTYASDVQNSWNALPADVIQAAVFFNIPESVALITGAYVTRFIIKMMPFT